MKKKNLLVRVLVPLVLAGLVFVGFSACSQDDGYPEGFVLNFRRLTLERHSGNLTVNVV